MYNSGDAAEQVVRMTLQGAEVTAKITGHAAKNIAVLLMAAAKEQEKTKGKTTLSAMLKSGKELKVFSIKEKDLKAFTDEAKRYGVLYCAIRAKNKSADGTVDIMVRAEDAPKINRIVERFNLANVDTASVTTEIEKARAEKSKSPVDKNTPEKSEDDKLVDQMLTKKNKKDKQTELNPTMAKTKVPQSEPISKRQKHERTHSTSEAKPSIRGKIKRIKEVRKKVEDAAHGMDVFQNQRDTANRTNDNKER